MCDMKTLYLTDLDGTLLRSDESVSGHTKNIVNHFVQGGGLFSYATARSFVTASKVTAGLNAEFPIICYNGAFIYGNRSKEILRSNFFTEADVARVKRVLTEHNIFPIVYAYIKSQERFSFLEHSMNDGIRSFVERRAGDPRCRAVLGADDLYAGDVFYFTCIGNEKELAPVYENFKSDRQLVCIYDKDMYSNDPWFEIMPANATKASAALQLKEMLGCDKLVVFGDGRNDLSLFLVADESYAMSNAVPELKEIATGVIGSNDDDGVAQWIEVNVL